MSNEQVVELDKAGPDPFLEIKIGDENVGSYIIRLATPNGIEPIGKGHNGDNPDQEPDIFPLPGTAVELAGSTIKIYSVIQPAADTTGGSCSLLACVRQGADRHQCKWTASMDDTAVPLNGYIKLTV